MQLSTVDGVRVLSAPGPGRVTAALVFDVGLRDETFGSVGVTHLLEHLVMASLPRTHLQCNGETDVSSTTFHATGRPAAVRDFLEAVCRALSDLPTDRLAQEVGIVQAEGCASGGGTAAALWAARYGLTGPGLAVADGAGPEFLSPELLRAHAARWFVRDNAVLWVHGDVPEGLHLPLPDGPRPSHALPVPRPQRGPLWVPGPGPGAGLLLASDRPRDPAVQVGVAVLAQRLRDVARHARGLSYAVQTHVLDLAPHRRELAVLVDSRRGQEAEVGRVLWEQFRALCSPGPTAEEVAHVVEGLAEELDVDPTAPDAVLAELTDAAGCLLDGVPYRPAADVLADWATVTPEEVRAELAAMSATALLHLPEGTRLGPEPGIEEEHWCGRLPELPQGTVYRAPLRSRLRGGGKAALAVAPGGLAHRDDDGDVHSLPWELVQAVVPVDDGRGLFVVAGNLCTVLVHPATYGPRAVAAVRAALPPWLQVLEQVTVVDPQLDAAAV